jgi:hypothetical protein
VESRTAFPHLDMTAAEDGYDPKTQRIVLTEMQHKSDNGK